MILGIIILLFNGQLIPAVEPFEDKATCEKALVEALENVAETSKGKAVVFIAECRKVV